MNTPEGANAPEPQKRVTEEHVKKMLKADMGKNAQLISWKVRDFTQSDKNNPGCFVTSLDIKFLEKGKKQETCYAVTINPSYLTGICDDFPQQEKTNFTSGIRSPVYFSLDSVDETNETISQDVVTEEHVMSALIADKGQDVRLISWECEDVNQKSTNSFLYHTNNINVFFSHQDNKLKTSYVVKYTSSGPKGKTGDFARLMFMKEIDFHMNLTQELNSELMRVGIHPLKVPLCFYANKEMGNEMMILEDIIPRGYQKHERWKSLDPVHATLVMKELAKCHASSLLLQNRFPEKTLSTRYNSVIIDLLTSNHTESHNILIWGIDNSLEILMHSDGHDKAVEWIKSCRSSVSKVMEELLQGNPQFDVVCLGDCWSNNMAFRYDADENPLEVMFLNSQWNQVASLTTDLSTFLLTSLSSDTRQQNVENFLATYFETFEEVAKAGGVTVPFTIQELRQEFDNKRLFGLFLAMVVVPIMIKGYTGLLNTEESSNGKSLKESNELRLETSTSKDTDAWLQFRFLNMFKELEIEGFF